MPIALEITLIVVLLAVAIALVPLLFQVRASLRGLDVFLVATRKDIAQIAEDVHATRLRMDHLAGTLQTYVDELVTFIQLMKEVGGTVKNLHTRFRNTIESASRNMGGILGGLSTVLGFFKSKRTTHATEQEQES